MQQNPIIYQTNYKAVSSHLDVQDAVKTVKIRKENVSNPTLSYFATGSRYQNKYFHDHEYDLYEYGRIIDTEALVARTFQKKKTLMFKQGYTITSKNPDNLAYVKQRLNEIEYVSQVPFRNLLREMAQNLIAFHNTYVAKARKKDASSGKIRMHRGKKEVQPVAAWFNMAPETMQAKINDAGEPKRYRQWITGHKYREFPEENVIHIAYNKRTGMKMGTPPLEAVKDDILALRRIEESVETLIYKSLFPIIHVQVGTEKHPARTLPNGQSEVSAAISLLENIEDNGGLVTSERVNVTSVGAESLALRVEAYLQHFKKRVYAGLGMSGIDFGDGDTTGRATGEVLSASLADSVIDYQIEIEETVTRQMFDELLLESGRYSAPYEITEDDRVFLQLRNVSTEEMVLKENHVINKVNSGLLTLPEARAELGKENLTEEELSQLLAYVETKKMNELEVEKARQMGEIETANAIKVSKAAPKPAAASSSSSGNKTGTTKSGNPKQKTNKQKGAGNAAKNGTAPKNTRDNIESSLIKLIHDGSTTNRLVLKAHRLLADYGMEKLTYGLLDAEDGIDKDLDTEIRHIVSDMLECLDTKDLNSIKINTIVGKAIDKIELYVNNIHCKTNNN
jgi:hypothetical protein